MTATSKIKQIEPICLSGSIYSFDDRIDFPLPLKTGLYSIFSRASPASTTLIKIMQHKQCV